LAFLRCRSLWQRRCGRFHADLSGAG
jgi:hypothetical protein